MFKRIAYLLVMLGLTAGLLLMPPAQGVNARSASQAAGNESEEISPQELLNPDGTLRVDGSFTGSIDLSGWNVQLDPQRGPLFAPPERGLQLADFGQWAQLGSTELTSYVNDIVISGNNVYVGGNFTNAGGIPEADYIAKWNGSSWSALGGSSAGDGSLTSFVLAIAVSGSDVYVGGNFIDVLNGGVYLDAAEHIAKWDGSNWSALGNNGTGNGSLNSFVYDIAVSGSDVYVGGNFTNVSNYGNVLAAADYIAKWNGTNWSALGSGSGGNGSLIGPVYAIAVSGSTVYVGGLFSDVNNNGSLLPAADHIAKWDGSSWSALGSGTGGNGSLVDEVFAIAVSGSDVYVGGLFINVDNYGNQLAAADYIAKWDGSNWSALGSGTGGNGSLNNAVYAIAVSGSNVYVGGSFSDVNNNGSLLGAADYIAKWDGSNWSALGSNGGSNGSLNNSVLALVADSTDLYAGGGFTNVNNNGSILNADYVAAYGIAAATTTIIASDNPDPSVPGQAVSVNVTVSSSSGIASGTVDISGADTNCTITLSGGSGSCNVIFASAGNKTLTATYNGDGTFAGSADTEAHLVINNATFADVPNTYWAWSWIERLYNAGITSGCSTNPLMYCPEDAVTRAQMAVFLERGIHGSGFSPPVVPLTFNDTAGNFAQYWIEALKNDGITGGCGPGSYCPEATTTRAEMAVFLLRSEHGSAYTPPAATGDFSDVPLSYWAAPWIEQLAAEGITSGCGTGIYCPDSPVTRAQMAVFLVRTFNLP